MFNRAVAEFFQGYYGDAVWTAILNRAQLSASDILGIDRRPRLARRVFVAGARQLHKDPAEILEDLGAWLVGIDPIRRLLRFSGTNFEEFIGSLAELPGRARMVIPHTPPIDIRLSVAADGAIVISVGNAPAGWIMVIAGALRAMADDYGTLVIISVSDQRITVWIASAQHGTQRPFLLHKTGPHS